MSFYIYETTVEKKGDVGMSNLCMCHLGDGCVWCEQGNEIKRLREGLKFYADNANWEWKEKHEPTSSNIYDDYGEKARQALEGVSNDQTNQT